MTGFFNACGSGWSHKMLGSAKKSVGVCVGVKCWGVGVFGVDLN